ncbi:MAG: hypothetical protein KAJ19_13135 [Gammaproteobacteria bacterium]|nr:hypothetical protein [Gammaproteobacteria bacterium]
MARKHKLKWRVCEVPSGRYRSFTKRGWPSADIDEKTAVGLSCEHEYIPERVRKGDHGPITIRVAKHNPEEEWPEKGGITWYRLTKTAATLKEAKERAQKFVDKRPEFFELEGS